MPGFWRGLKRPLFRQGAPPLPELRRCTVRQALASRFAFLGNFTMSTRFQRTLVWFCMLAGGVAAYSSAFAESLAERRLSIIKRSSAGIVLLDLPSESRPAAQAPGTASAAALASPTTAVTTDAAASPKPSTAATGAVTTSTASASAASAKPAEAAAPQPAVLNRFFSTMPPASGRSLQDARRLDAPDQGVTLPFTRSTPAPAVEPDSKR